VKRLGLLFVALATAFGNWYLFLVIAQALNLEDAHFLAATLTASIVIHEIGHMIVLESYGIKTFMFFAVIIGGVGPQKAYLEKFKNLDWLKNCKVALAGVVGNFIVIFLGFALLGLDYISYEQASKIANLNGILIFWNLIPIGTLDGGRAAKALFDSIPENEDGKYVAIFRIGALAGSAALILFNFGNVILAVYAFFFSVKYRSTHDDPDGSRNQKAMKRNEYKKWSLIYLSLFMGGLVFGSVFPDWIVL